MCWPSLHSSYRFGQSYWHLLKLAVKDKAELKLKPGPEFGRVEKEVLKQSFRRLLSMCMSHQRPQCWYSLIWWQVHAHRPAVFEKSRVTCRKRVQMICVVGCVCTRSKLWDTAKSIQSCRRPFKLQSFRLLGRWTLCQSFYVDCNWQHSWVSHLQNSQGRKGGRIISMRSRCSQSNAGRPCNAWRDLSAWWRDASSAH